MRSRVTSKYTEDVLYEISFIWGDFTHVVSSVNQCQE